MDLQALTPALEQLSINEEISPKSPNTSPKPNLNLRPVNSVVFKNEKWKTKKEEKAKNTSNHIEQAEESNQQTPLQPSNPPVSDIEWPCEPSPVSWLPEHGWGDRKPPQIPPASSEEQARVAAVKLQQNALRSSRDFLSKKEFLNSEGEYEEDEEDDDEEEEDLVDQNDFEAEILNFFLGLFAEDRNLRSYYEKNWGRGVFCCLVCGGMGEKIKKRFKDCFALVQHSAGISKTKSIMAHRGFGKVVCGILGWNADRLLSIGRAELQANLKENGAIDKKDDPPKEIVDSVGKQISES